MNLVGAPLIKVDNFSFSHAGSNPVVLRELSFEIVKGSILAILGPNGSGKTTLLKALANLHGANQKTTGEIFLEQKNIKAFSRRELARLVSYVPSNVETEFSVTVLDFVAQSRFSYNEDFGKSLVKADLCLEKVGLLPMREISFRSLSSGERQLALLARAFAQETQVLLLDESFSHLDLNFQYRISQLIKEFKISKNLTVIFVSHDLNLATEICSDILWLKNGEIKKCGPVNDAFSAALLSEIYPGAPFVVGKNTATGAPKVFFGC